MAIRLRRIPVIALLAGALVALAIPAQAAFEPEWEECATRATSLTTTAPELGSGGKASFTVSWDAEFINDYRGCDAADEDEMDEYFGWIVQWNNDWRPQQWELLVVKWSEGKVKFSGMLPGRTYNIRVLGFEVGEPDELQERVEQRVQVAPDATISVTVPPRQGKPGDREQGWAVSLGDSFISGEAGRWAGNTSNDMANTNDTGFTAYWDTPADEEFDYCHRSKSALIHIGTLRSMNFACSGAITTSQYLNVGSALFPEWTWRPGPLPIPANVTPPAGLPRLPSQSDMLRDFAREKKALNQPVKLVVLSIGGNNFFFSKIVTQCVEAFLLPSATNCETWDDAQHWISQEWQNYVQAQVEDSIEEVVKAMRDAGYADGSWTFIQHSYPKPIPNSLRFRYPEGFNGRQSIAGCGFYDAAADWAVKIVTPIVGGTVYRAVHAVRTNPRYAGIPMFFMDPQDAFSSHELCAQGVYRLNTPSERERRGPKSWIEPGAALDSEWVKDIDALQQEGTEKDESFHPNYWGQLALRNCLRQMWNRGEVLGDGACRIGPRKMTKRGEPKMTVEITRIQSPRADARQP